MVETLNVSTIRFSLLYLIVYSIFNSLLSKLKDSAINITNDSVFCFTIGGCRQSCKREQIYGDKPHNKTRLRFN